MESLVIFTDGASSGNPGPGGWGVAILTPEGEVTELGGGVAATTNNRMELIAVIRGLDAVRGVEKPVDVFTDSTYVIRGITQWIWAWRKDWAATEERGIANVDLWKQLWALVGARRKPYEVRWNYVRGHAGNPGNERVDFIAVAFTKNQRPALYRGPETRYDIDLRQVPEDTSLPPMRPASAPKAAAYSYLSLVNGVPMRHKTWPECEARVKGRSGAKFKKTASADEERDLLMAWGFSPDEV